MQTPRVAFGAGDAKAASCLLPHVKIYAYSGRMTAAELLTLAKAYADGLGITLGTAGTRAAGNNQLFPRLDKGFTCTARSIERAEAWFVENWPEEVPWPEAVPRPRREAA
jgi:hypothetical protein